MSGNPFQLWINQMVSENKSKQEEEEEEEEGNTNLKKNKNNDDNDIEIEIFKGTSDVPLPTPLEIKNESLIKKYSNHNKSNKNQETNKLKITEDMKGDLNNILSSHDQRRIKHMFHKVSEINKKMKVNQKIENNPNEGRPESPGKKEFMESLYEENQKKLDQWKKRNNQK